MPAPEQELQPSSRLLNLDALRGLIIVLMTLDHANYFLAGQHSSGEHWGGPFPTYSSALPFVTRLVTHPAAPGFFFLMGAGMVLFARARDRAGWDGWQIMRHFIIRGLLLIGLQFLLVNRAWELGPGTFPRLYLGVLYALGGCMILASPLVRLKPAPLLVIAAALFVGLELSHPCPSQWGLIFAKPLGLMFGYSGGSQLLWSNYPILPWLELVTLGMAFGHWFRRDSKMAARRAMYFGVVFLLGFALLRAANGFGNIRPRPGSSWIDFLNTVKYPPSMTFSLMTMGVVLLLLWLLTSLERRGAAGLKPLAVLGRAPLFCYVVHLFLYAGLGRLLPAGGIGIPAMVPYWIMGLLLLFPSAWWLGTLKGRQPMGSPLRYF